MQTAYLQGQINVMAGDITNLCRRLDKLHNQLFHVNHKLHLCTLQKAELQAQLLSMGATQAVARKTHFLDELDE